MSIQYVSNVNLLIQLTNIKQMYIGLLPIAEFRRVTIGLQNEVKSIEYLVITSI